VHIAHIIGNVLHARIFQPQSLDFHNKSGELEILEVLKICVFHDMTPHREMEAINVLKASAS
jgi:hypothetical protein